MKKSKWTRLLSVLLALVMALSMNVLSVFAAEETGSITIKGPTGEDNNPISLEGATATAYQVLERIGSVSEESNLYTYKVTEQFTAFFSSIKKSAVKATDTIYLNYNESEKHLELGQGSGTITINLENKKLESGDGFEADLLSRLTSNSGPIATMSNWLQQYAEANNLTGTKATGNNSGKIVIENLDPGYYLVVLDNLPDGVVIQNAILEVVPGNEEEIGLKGDVPDHDKQVKNEEDTDFSDSATGEIGDTLNYKLTYEIPEITATETWKIIALHDVLDNQKVAADSFELKVTQGAEATEVFSGNTKNVVGTPVGGDGYTISFSNGEFYTIPATAMKYELRSGEEAVANLYIVPYDETKNEQHFYLELTDKGIEKLKGEKSTLTLTYDATLTEDAVQVNGNEVDWVIDNGTDTNKDKDKTEVYTYGIKLKKEYSGNEDLSELANSTVFELYRGAKENGNLMKFISLGGGRYRVATEEESESQTTSDLKPHTDGTLTILGLDEDTYVLVEKQAPDGYEKIADTIIKLVAKTDPNEQNVLDGDQCEVSGGAAKDDTDGSYITIDEDTSISLLKLKALNQKGFDLPTTGGAGTWMFTLGGIALIVLAGGVLIAASRRKPGKK